MELGGWNQRLAEHFGALAGDRLDLPLFALEHGLARAEVLALSDEIRSHIRLAPPAREHALAWTVYAAEIGYGYSGAEYWQTFEEQTPGWTERGDRGWIRDAFVAFRKKYAGAEPSGAWAKQFSIICWPITHAILPCDLQQQLAWILYELRHSFSAELFDSPLLLGQFIAARSWNTSARFQNLVQEPALVGQIAAALLLQGRPNFKALLHPVTLKRIGDDVDRERRGRDWLRGARHAAEERSTIRGLPLGRATAKPIERKEEARAEIVKLGIEPRLVLRPIGESRWEVALEIPDLSHLLLRFPQVRDVLTESRCTVAGASGRPLARGRCLHGPQRVALSRWPRPDEVLLKFERVDAQLEYLLRAECLLRPAKTWLFKVSSDGLAYESRGMRVRADSKYLLVSTEPFARSDVTRHVELTCEGMHAVLIDVPASLTADWERVLRQLKVTQAKSIEVWPAGLAAAAWDEGHGEWLVSETPTLAIRSDHAIDELTIAMGGGGPSLSLTLTDTPPGEPIFIELPQMTVGLHTFSVAARSRTGAASELIGDLDVVMRVREARPWSPGITTHGPLDVELEPSAPLLEELWEGNASVVVRGPAGRQLDCRVRMFTRASEKPSFETQLPALTLPISSGAWSRHFEAHLKRQGEAQLAYDAAHVCEVEFSADELGFFKLRCEREFKPLRWSLRKEASGFVARLHDDAGNGVPSVERYSFETPTAAEKVPPAAEHRAPRVGGLYVATIGEFEAAIVVPPIVRGLAELKCEPKIDGLERTTRSVEWLVSVARLWGTARLSGDLIGGGRQRLVVRTLAARLWTQLAGNDWGRKEEEFSREEIGLRELRRAIPPPRPRDQKAPGRLAIPADAIFPQDVLRRLASAPLHERGTALVNLVGSLQLIPPVEQKLAPTARPSGPGLAFIRRQNSTWLAEFALRIASDPATVRQWAAENFEQGVTKLWEAPALARAARFLVLAVDQLRHSELAPGETYAGWGWSA